MTQLYLEFTKKASELMEELKRCPFCGESAHTSHIYKYFSIICSNCGSATAWAKDEETASKLWRMRTNNKELISQIAIWDDFMPLLPWNQDEEILKYMNGLEKCPCCESNGILSINQRCGHYFVICGNCYISSGLRVGYDECVQAWNTRAEGK